MQSQCNPLCRSWSPSDSHDTITHKCKIPTMNQVALSWSFKSTFLKLSSLVHVNTVLVLYKLSLATSAFIQALCIYSLVHTMHKVRQ